MYLLGHGRHGRHDVNEPDRRRISFDPSCDVSIFGIQNQIERVIANIVANALQAMGEHGRISITTKSLPTNFVNITITNTGSSIPDEDLVNIFHPFFTKGKADGTGLGLAICRRIVTDHNGTIEATSSLSDGTSFHISLPQFDTV
jgi:signal transduction histidine kinase